MPFKRNAFRNFSEKNIDFRLQKKFTLAGKHQIILSAEVFNAFGFDNVLLGTGATFANYCANVNDATCGFSGPTNPTFGKVKGADGKYIAGSLPGPAAPVAGRSALPLLDSDCSPRSAALASGTSRAPASCVRRPDSLIGPSRVRNGRGGARTRLPVGSASRSVSKRLDPSRSPRADLQAH